MTGPRRPRAKAQEQADKCLADAAANAIRVTEEANQKKAEIEAEMRRLTTERSRLLADMEALAGTLSTVAREATGALLAKPYDPGLGCAARPRLSQWPVCKPDDTNRSAHAGQPAQQAQ